MYGSNLKSNPNYGQMESFQSARVCVCILLDIDIQLKKGRGGWACWRTEIDRAHFGAVTQIKHIKNP